MSQEALHRNQIVIMLLSNNYIRYLLLLAVSQHTRIQRWRTYTFWISNRNFFCMKLLLASDHDGFLSVNGKPTAKRVETISKLEIHCVIECYGSWLSEDNELFVRPGPFNLYIFLNFRYLKYYAFVPVGLTLYANSWHCVAT